MADLGRLTFLLWRQESAGFGDSKWDGVPETETLGHRPGELRVQPETRETGVIEHFSPKHTEECSPSSRLLSARD